MQTDFTSNLNVVGLRRTMVNAMRFKPVFLNYDKHENCRNFRIRAEKEFYNLCQRFDLFNYIHSQMETFCEIVLNRLFLNGAYIEQNK